MSEDEKMPPVEVNEEVRRLLDALADYEPLIDKVIGLRKRFIAEGFDETIAGNMAAATYIAGLAPILASAFGK